jgi:hypothetical protein
MSPSHFFARSGQLACRRDHMLVHLDSYVGFIEIRDASRHIQHHQGTFLPLSKIFSPHIHRDMWRLWRGKWVLAAISSAKDGTGTSKGVLEER